MCISSNGWDFQTVTNVDFQSQSAPGLTAMGTDWLLAWRRIDNSHICFSRTRNHAWLSAQTAKAVDGSEFATSDAPAVVRVGNRALMAWKGFGEDTRIWYSWYSPTDNTWTPQVVATGEDGQTFGTSKGPSLAVVGNRILMTWKGQGRDSRIWSAYLDPSASAKPWSAQRSLGGSDGISFGTSERPVAANADGTLVLAWRGSGDSNLWYATCPADGQVWSPQRKAASAGVDFSSSTGPALVAHGADILLTWKGYDKDTNIWQSTMNADAGAHDWSPQQTCIGDGVAFGTATPPALACNGEEVRMVWRGSGDQYLWQSGNYLWQSGTEASRPKRVQVPAAHADRSTWMGDLHRELGAGFGNLQIRQMTLPGCHQAGTYRVEWNLGQAPDIATLTAICHDVGVQEETVMGWAKAQSANVESQLKAGARCLDLRIAECKADRNRFYTFHSLFCVPWDEIIENITDFASRHRSEVVILQLNPLFLPDSRWDEFLSDLSQRLDEFLVPNHVGASATYDAVMRTGGNIICMVNEHVLNKDRQKHHPKLWGSVGANVAWFNKQSGDELLAVIREYIDNGAREGFSGIQAIITPGAKLIGKRKGIDATASFAFDKACMDALNASFGGLPLLLKESVSFHQELLSELVTKTLADEKPLGIVMIDAINELSGGRIADLCIEATKLRSRSPQHW